MEMRALQPGSHLCLYISSRAVFLEFSMANTSESILQSTIYIHRGHVVVWYGSSEPFQRKVLSANAFLTDVEAKVC